LQAAGAARARGADRRRGALSVGARLVHRVAAGERAARGQPGIAHARA
jgi:hypothetical protein